MPFVDYTLWKQAPFLRLILPLIAGIIFVWCFEINITISVVASLGVLLGLIISFLLAINIKFSGEKLKSLLLYLLLFLLGAFLTIYNDASHRSDFAGKFLNDSSLVIFRINEPLSEKPASWKAGADIVEAGKGNQMHKTSGKAILYLPKTGSIRPLQYGDIIITKNRLQPVLNSGNPGGFDYERYCHLQNIFYQSSLKEDSWSKASVTQSNILQSFFLESRSRCVKILSAYISGHRESGIAEALLAGYRDNVDKDLMQAYANAGVVHIIAISGLHLGLIYLMLLLIFKPLKNTGRTRWIKGIFIILSLWCFAMITGASPSALRAALMFSFIAAGRFFIKRQTNIYNTLAASAFLLLCYNPYLLFNVGFQLSYLAVLGIVIFQKPIFSLLISENKIWNYFWRMMSVSIAAELLTFPVAIYYFHRFPVMFLAANLVIIPLATSILYGEIALLTISFIRPVAVFTGIILSKSIALMNGIIERINNMTFSGLTVSYTLTETMLMYAFIAAWAIWLVQKNKKAWTAGLLFLLCFSMSKMRYNVQAILQKKLIVYNIPKHQAMDFVDGKSVMFRGDPAVLTNNTLMQNNVLPARIFFHSGKKDSIQSVVQRNHFIQYHNTRIVIIDSNNYDVPQHIFFPVDYVLISHHARPDFQRIKDIFSPKLLIFDASNPLWKTKQWKTACDSLHLHCFSVQEEGAWVADIR